jgi:hypothetical protein
MVKKKVDVAVALLSSTKAFPMVRFALQLELPTTAASISGLKVGRSAGTLVWMADWRQ